MLVDNVGKSRIIRELVFLRSGVCLSIQQRAPTKNTPPHFGGRPAQKNLEVIISVSHYLNTEIMAFFTSELVKGLENLEEPFTLSGIQISKYSLYYCSL